VAGRADVQATFRCSIFEWNLASSAIDGPAREIKRRNLKDGSIERTCASFDSRLNHLLEREARDRKPSTTVFECKPARFRLPRQFKTTPTTARCNKTAMEASGVRGTPEVYRHATFL
jgi:hypothetical protein